MVVFAVQEGEDRTWMPRYDLDDLGWSFGLVVVSAFTAFFSLLAITVFTLMRKWERLPRDEWDYRSAKILHLPPSARI